MESLPPPPPLKTLAFHNAACCVCVEVRRPEGTLREVLGGTVLDVRKYGSEDPLYWEVSLDARLSSGGLERLEKIGLPFLAQRDDMRSAEVRHDMYKRRPDLKLPVIDQRGDRPQPRPPMTRQQDPTAAPSPADAHANRGARAAKTSYAGQEGGWNEQWLCFLLGWFFWVPWAVGTFLPCCRHPRFPTRSHKAGWRANISLFVVSVVVTVVVVIPILAVSPSQSPQPSTYIK